jgi:DNA-binding transcriptional LysR family regulator
MSQTSTEEIDCRIGSPLTLRDLRILLTVADAGSMSKAANLLHVSQPAISKSIAQIERDLGSSLMKRSSRGIEPTLHGQVLLARIRTAFGELHGSVEAMKAHTEPHSGELRIAASQVALSTLLPKVINRIYAEYPAIAFHVVPALSLSDQVRVLEQRKVELVVARIPSFRGKQQLQTHELFKDRFVVVTGKGHRWKRRKSLELAELMGEPWSLAPLDTVTGRSMAQVFEAHGLGLPPIKVVAPSIYMQRQLAFRSGFLTLLSFNQVRTDKGIDVLPVTLRGEEQAVGILTVKHLTPSPLADLFIRYAHEVAGDDYASE